MAGNCCFSCGLDFKMVKLRQVSTFDEKGRPVQITSCDHCKEMMIKGNHLENREVGEQAPGVDGFVKPSTDAPPAIRPQ